MRGDAYVQAVVGEIVRRVVAEYAPEAIIRFGPAPTRSLNAVRRLI